MLMLTISLLLSSIVLPIVTASTGGRTLVSAADSKEQLCAGAGGTYSGGACTPADSRNIGSILTSIVNILLFLVGAVSVIMIVLGGFRYVISAGDQNAVTAAKNTILYAVIGLVVAFLGSAAVNFIVSNLVG